MKNRTILLLCLAIIIISLTAVATLEDKNAAAIQKLKSTEPVKPVHIATPEPAPIETPEATPEPTAYIALTAEQRTLIATVCESEDNVNGLEGLLGVACTLRNRYKDGRFGNGIEGICIASQFHGLYAPKEPSGDAYKAVDMAFFDGCEDVTNGGLYFCTAATDPDKIKSGLTETARAGGHVFYTDLEDKP